MASTRFNNDRITQEKLMKMIEGNYTFAGSFKEHLANEIVWGTTKSHKLYQINVLQASRVR